MRIRPGPCLVAFAAACLVAGGVFPVVAKLADPFYAYGIVFVSFPAWALGALAGGAAALIARWKSGAGAGTLRWGLVAAIANLAAALATLQIPFTVS